MTDAELFEDLRRPMLGIAYRMLGSVAGAEDVVQEAFLRLFAARRRGERIDSPRAYLSTIVTRLSIDELRSARARRETYVGEWLPEPVVDEAGVGGDPAALVEQEDSLSMAFLLLLERLSPRQRAAFLLHDVFAYGYDEVAEIVRTSEANARQLAARSRRLIGERRPRFEASRERRDALAERFFAAAGDGDIEELEALLADDVRLIGDGGGKAPALARILSGRARVARTLRNWARAARRLEGLRMRRVTVNGQPGLVYVREDGSVFSVLALDIADGRVQVVRGIVNPDKLSHLRPM
ncbi:MAG: RNA polymerase sigma factor SigJ [Thermoleophilia bacterium]